jgi:MFS family permease
MSYRRLLSRSDARRYLAGQTLSLLGDSSMWMACGIWVKSLTGSNGAAGLVFFFFLAPAVAAPLAGLVVDRVRRRPLLVALNLLGALILVPLFAVQDAGDVWIVYVVMLLYGVVNIAIAPAQSALLHRMLPDDLLASANGALRTAQESLRILAPLAGAGLYAAFGGRAVVILDIITFLAAAAFIRSLSVREPRPGRPDGHVLAGVFDGLRFIRNSPVLRPATIAGIVLTAVIGFSESTTWAVISDGLHRPPEFAGILQLAQGVGAITAGLFAAAAVTRYGETRVAGFGTAVFALGEACLVVPGLVPVLVGKTLIGGGLPMLIIAVITLLQRSAPDHLQGRVYAGFEVVTTVPQTCSVALGAWMIGVLDYRLVIGLAAIVAATSALMMIRIRRPAEPGEQERSYAPENRLLAHGRTT